LPLRRGHRRASPAAHCRNRPTRSVTPPRLRENSPKIVIVRSTTRGRVLRRSLVARYGPRPSLVLRRGRQLQPLPHHGDVVDAARIRRTAAPFECWPTGLCKSVFTRFGRARSLSTNRTRCAIPPLWRRRRRRRGLRLARRFGRRRDQLVP
jgi:hypothetical protein